MHGTPLNPRRRERAQELADLLTPLSKAWSTDLGVELTSIAVQVFGGMGFIEETGVAQHYRDSRIAPIYEGTNGIQALDLVGRKLAMRDGAVIQGLLDDMDGWAKQRGADPLTAAVAAVRSATEWMKSAAPLAQMAGATPYLRALATTVGGWMMDRQAAATVGGTDEYLVAKRTTAAFYMSQILPTVHSLCELATAGPEVIMASPPTAFASR